MSAGYTCTPEELELSIASNGSQIYCLTRGQSFGLLVSVFNPSQPSLTELTWVAQCGISLHINHCGCVGIHSSLGERIGCVLPRVTHSSTAQIRWE